MRPSENYVFDREYNFYEALRDSGVTAAKDAWYGSEALDLLLQYWKGSYPDAEIEDLLRKTGRLDD